jgi:hypothetical protein
MMKKNNDSSSVWFQSPTTQQIIRLTEIISINLNQNNTTGIIGLEKAFDLVWQDAAIHKMMKLKFGSAENSFILF